MLVGKNKSAVINSELLVDNWNVGYSDTGEEDIIETDGGQIHIISSAGRQHDQYLSDEEEINWSDNNIVGKLNSL